jgi:hypothetical protein
MHCTNNTVVLDHCRLFIYLDNGYFGSFHDVNILLKSNMYKNLHQFFLHIYEYFEFYWGTQAIWVKRCLLCDSLGVMNLPLSMT